jgi:hypothetical protein
VQKAVAHCDSARFLLPPKPSVLAARSPKFFSASCGRTAKRSQVDRFHRHDYGELCRSGVGRCELQHSAAHCRHQWPSIRSPHASTPLSGALLKRINSELLVLHRSRAPRRESIPSEAEDLQWQQAKPCDSAACLRLNRDIKKATRGVLDGFHVKRLEESRWTARPPTCWAAKSHRADLVAMVERPQRRRERS